MIYFLQITAVIFSLVMIYFAILNYKREEIESNEFLIWFVVWIGVIFVALFPDVMQFFAKTFFFARLFDMVVVGGFILLIVMAAKNYSSMRKLEKKLEKYVRKEALKEEKEE